MMDVAKLAGVSQTTVSLVLNQVAGIRISEDARRRVMAAAAGLGYRIGARGGGRQRVLGFLADELSTSPFAVLSVDAARDAAAESNAILIIAACRGDPALEAAVLDLWYAQGVAGVIYARIFTCRINPPPQLRQHRSVLLNCYDPKGAFAAMVPAEQRGGMDATRHLLRQGHSRIGLINGEPWMQAARDRAAGYRRALRVAGLPLDPALVRSGDWTSESGRDHTMALMAMPQPPTAIFCANDPMAAGCYDALARLRLRVPNDVSVLGYDNQPLARQLDPPLTTLNLPHAEMGRLAAECLLGPAAPRARTARLECGLIQRRSVAPPRPTIPPAGSGSRPMRTETGAHA